MKTPPNAFSLIATARAAANNFLKEELSRAGLEGLVPTHGNILFTLMRHPEMTMSDLAIAIRRDKSTVTALVKKLESEGYVSRVVSHGDSRTINVVLTKKGETLRNPFMDISKRLFSVGLQGIDEKDLLHLGETLEKIIQNFNR